MPLVLELVGACLVLMGIGLLLTASGIRLAHGAWTRTEAVSFEHRGHPYLRWHDHRYRIVEALWWSGTRARRRMPSPRAAGEDVIIFYSVRDPARWSPDEPYRGTRLVAVGGLLAGLLGTALGLVPL